jgi:hypothetical protein
VPEWLPTQAARIFFGLGDVLEAQDRAAASELWRQAAAVLAPFAAGDSSPTLLVVYAKALLRCGRRHEAVGVAARIDGEIDDAAVAALRDGNQVRRSEAR